LGFLTYDAADASDPDPRLNAPSSLLGRSR
jgi:hypothetical protein